MNIRALLFTTAVIFALSPVAQSANLYRYTDPNGTVVLGRTIPPGLVSGGYTILNEQGAVLKIVPPALSDEEKTAQRNQELQQQSQQARDEELLRLYRSGSDVDRAKQAWMSRLDVEISLKRNQLSVKRAKLADIQSRAAELERQGKPVTDEILEELDQVIEEMSKIRLSIAAVEKKKKEDEQMFERDKARVIELLGS